MFYLELYLAVSALMSVLLTKATCIIYNTSYILPKLSVLVPTIGVDHYCALPVYISTCIMTPCDYITVTFLYTINHSDRFRRSDFALKRADRCCIDFRLEVQTNICFCIVLIKYEQGVRRRCCPPSRAWFALFSSLLIEAGSKNIWRTRAVSTICGVQNQDAIFLHHYDFF